MEQYESIVGWLELVVGHHEQNVGRHEQNVGCDEQNAGHKELNVGSHELITCEFGGPSTESTAGVAVETWGCVTEPLAARCPST